MENRCLQYTSFFDQMINSIALTHKNPRVKQFVIDRVQVLIEMLFMTADG